MEKEFQWMPMPQSSLQFWPIKTQAIDMSVEFPEIIFAHGRRVIWPNSLQPAPPRVNRRGIPFRWKFANRLGKFSGNFGIGERRSGLGHRDLAIAVAVEPTLDGRGIAMAVAIAGIVNDSPS